jgi:hypothetical protein
MCRIIRRMVLMIVRMRVIVHQISMAMFVGMDDDPPASFAFRADGGVDFTDPPAFGAFGALAHSFFPFIRRINRLNDFHSKRDFHLHHSQPFSIIDSDLPSEAAVLFPPILFRILDTHGYGAGFEIVENMVNIDPRRDPAGLF